MQWAARRQFMYGSVVVLFVLIAVGVPVYFKYFNNQPTCFDQKQNGNEGGIDCGGSCEKACYEDVIPLPVTIWSRAFHVTSGFYNLAAYAQNANVNYVGQSAKYIFRVYDKDNVLLGVREGYADVPPTKNFAIFEQGFNAGTRIPVSTFFEFTRGIIWKKYEGVKPELAVTDERLTNIATSPRIDAVLLNKTINTYSKIEVVALIYDDQGNAMAASRTLVDSLGSEQSAPLVFTWPEIFPRAVSKIEIIPKLPIATTL